MRRTVTVVAALWCGAWALVAGAQEIAVPSSGSPVKPRVLVIMDTSTSMQEDPKYGSNFEFYPTDDTDMDADSVVPDTRCRSKFCVAKKVIYDTFKAYSDDARLGLGTYYQYLVRYDASDLRRGKCWYDVMYKPGRTLRYPRSGLPYTPTLYASGTPVDLGAQPDSQHSQCVAGATHTYPLTLVDVGVLNSYYCDSYDRPGFTPSFTVPAGPPAGAGDCTPGATYSATGYWAVERTFSRRVGVGATCGAATPMFSDYNLAPFRLPITGPVDGTEWYDWGGWWGSECSPSMPCVLYSTNNTSTPVNARESWYGAFSGSCAGPRGNLLGQCPWGTLGNVVPPAPDWGRSGNPARIFNHPSRVTGSTTSVSSTRFGQAQCTIGGMAVPVGTTQRVTSGNLSDYLNAADWNFFWNARPAGSARYQPSNGACTPEWPCDITLTQDTPVDNWTAWTTVQTCPGVLPAGTECRPLGGPLPTVYEYVKHNAGACDLPVGADQTATPARDWLTSAPTCTAADTDRCVFNPPLADGVRTNPGGACSQRIFWDGTTVVPDCTFGSVNPGTFSYGTAVTSTFPITRRFPAGTESCQASGSNLTSAAGFSPFPEANDCVNSGACRLSNATGPLATTPDLSPWVGGASTPTPPAGWSGVHSGERNAGAAFTSGQQSACLAYTVGQYYENINGRFARYLGTVVIGMSGETPILGCNFQPVERQWSRAMESCRYDITRRVFNVTVPTCRYRLRGSEMRSQLPQTHNCVFRATLQRFDFQFPDYGVCTYFRTRSQFVRNDLGYSYSYTTKGGELVGRVSRDIPDVGPSCSTLSDADLQGRCPAVVDNCTSGDTVCRLRNADLGSIAWNSTTHRTQTGRLMNFRNPGVNVTLGTAGNTCQASDWGSAPTVPARNLYCVDNGASAPQQYYRLVSDYYHCPSGTCLPNDVSMLNADTSRGLLPTSLSPTTPARLNLLPQYAPWDAGYVEVAGPLELLTPASITGASTKSNGLSVVGANLDEPSMQFITFAQDADATGKISEFKKLMGGCVWPNANNVDWTNKKWNSNGICMPFMGAPAAPPSTIGDYTPLVGSLRNAADYIRKELETDPNHICRQYVVVLATDGNENTPAGYGPPDMVDAVNQLRNIATGSGRRTAVDTYVLGFGDRTTDVAAATALNAMAVAGNTGGAYFADDQASLRTRLNQVFANILRGTYSRGRPTIGTDGKSLYTSHFIRGGSSPEWEGRFSAWDLDTAGGALERWEFSSILNAQAPASRRLFTDVSGTRRDFDEASVPLMFDLNQDSNYPGGPGTTAVLDPVNIVRFIRNDSRDQPFNLPPPVVRRQSRFNAMVHTTAVVVGRSELPIDWGGPTQAAKDAFVAFKEQPSIKNREVRLMLGGSDGMIRSVRDVTTAGGNQGTEAWGWVPAPVRRFLYKAMQGIYSGVDGQFSVTDVCGTGSDDAASCDTGDWRTMMFAAYRGGARGLSALDITNPTNPQFQWNFTPAAQLAYTYSGPIVGRVRLSGRDRFITVLGGGYRGAGVEGPMGADQGDEVWVLNAITGTIIDFFNDATNGMHDRDIFNQDNQFAARPSFFQRAGSAYMENAVFATTNGRLYMMRFREPPRLSGGSIISDPRDSSSQWRPEIFFDPSAPSTSRHPEDRDVKVRRVQPVAGDYDLVPTGEQLPLPPGRALPFYVRPRHATLYSSDKSFATFYVGTGDSASPENPAPEFLQGNYFYAVHDIGRRADGKFDGRALWVNRFEDDREQVLSEPALVGGTLVVATYTPPTTTSPCEAAGDAKLYCFNPVDGDLVDCLMEDAVGPDAGTNMTSVKKFSNVGIPSDLVVIKNNLYFTTSSPPRDSNGNVDRRPIQQKVAPVLGAGDIRSYRRTR